MNDKYKQIPLDKEKEMKNKIASSAKDLIFLLEHDFSTIGDSYHHENLMIECFLICAKNKINDLLDSLETYNIFPSNPKIKE